MVSKSSLSSRAAAGLGIVLLAALPALAQTTPVPAPAVPATSAATVAPADRHGATDAQKDLQKKAATTTTAKDTHKDAPSVLRKHHAQTAQMPAKKAEEPVKTDSAGQRL
jgi:hypothetical protein